MRAKEEVFRDSDTLARSVDSAQVTAIQRKTGPFLGDRLCAAVGGWSLQFLRFHEGYSASAGDVPRQDLVCLVPLALAPDFRILGRVVDRASFGLYGPGAEHADTTGPGVHQVVAIPPSEFVGHADAHELLAPRRIGSAHTTGDPSTLDALRTLLLGLDQKLRTVETVLGDEQVERSLADALFNNFEAAIGSVSDPAHVGRPAVPRPEIIRKINELIRSQDGEPLYQSELCAEAGVSVPTLRRIFLDRYGLPPSRYLLVRRFYIARERLRSGRYETVSEVAQSCGFWDLSRFAISYRKLFGEAPSRTLRGDRTGLRS